MLAKAASVPADALVPDLMSSVPDDEKAHARKATAAALSHLAHPKRKLIPRINQGSAGMMEEDLAAVVTPHTYGICVGMATRPEDIQHIDWAIGRAETKAGIAVGILRLIPFKAQGRGAVTLEGWLVDAPVAARASAFASKGGRYCEGDGLTLLRRVPKNAFLPVRSSVPVLLPQNCGILRFNLRRSLPFRYDKEYGAQTADNHHGADCLPARVCSCRWAGRGRTRPAGRAGGSCRGCVPLARAGAAHQVRYPR